MKYAYMHPVIGIHVPFQTNITVKQYQYQHFSFFIFHVDNQANLLYITQRNCM